MAVSFLSKSCTRYMPRLRAPVSGCLVTTWPKVMYLPPSLDLLEVQGLVNSRRIEFSVGGGERRFGGGIVTAARGGFTDTVGDFGNFKDRVYGRFDAP